MLFDLASSIAFSKDTLVCADVSVVISKNVINHNVLLANRNALNRDPDSHREQSFFNLVLYIEFFIFFYFLPLADLAD